MHDIVDQDFKIEFIKIKSNLEISKWYSYCPLVLYLLKKKDIYLYNLSISLQIFGFLSLA